MVVGAKKEGAAPAEASASPIFSWKPAAVLALQIWVLRVANKEWADASPWRNPFEECTYVLPAVMSLLYLAGVAYGRRWIRDPASRPAFELREYMFMYNLYQTILNAWSVVMFVIVGIETGMSIWGNTVDTSKAGYRIGFLIWVHYNNKYIELLDTVRTRASRL